MPHSVRITDESHNMNRLLGDCKKLNGAFVKVGYPAGGRVGKMDSKGSGHARFKNLSEVATVAVTHELGSVSKNIPPRPTVRPAIDKNKKAIKELQAKLVDKVFHGKISVEGALDVLGEYLVSLIKKEITALLSPALSPKTIKRKKSTKPLIDRGQMRNSVTFKRAHK